MAHTFSVLHISDLHERGAREEEWARRYRVLGDAWRRNLDDLCAEGAIDIVCFTGDLVDWGKTEEYENVTPFVDELLAQLQLDYGRLFVVPGNHDIDRSIGRSEWERLRSNLDETNAQQVARWLELKQGKAPRGFEDHWRDAVLQRQANYRRWLQKIGLNSQVPEHSGRRLGYRIALRLPALPFDIQVIGLDSAWLAGDNSDAGKLRLTDSQVLSLCADSKKRGRPLDGFRLALVHHPLTDLADGGECRRRLAESVDLLLRGHLHDTEPELWADPDHTLRAIAAGCLYEGDAGDKYPNSCVLARITCDDLGQPLSFELRFRTFSPRSGSWFDDGSLYREAPQGRLKIRLDASTSEEFQPKKESVVPREPREVLVPASPPSPPPPSQEKAEPPAAAPQVLHSSQGQQAKQTPLNPPIAPSQPEGQRGARPHFVVGSQVGDYRIVRLLGQGGMGSVYEAVKVSIGRHVALKFLHAEIAQHQDAVLRFLNEAKASSRIEHPSIIHISEVGQSPDGRPYLVMEFLKGESLAERLRKLAPPQQRLPLIKVLQVAWQTADALAAAHAAGIVHRDVKPDNLMLVPDPVAPGKERVKLLDFGIAKLTQVLTISQPMTSDNQLLGTPMYMSPEQCRRSASVDHKSDVYALGVVLYEMLAGRPPFLADQIVHFLTQHVMEEPPPLVTLAPDAPSEVAGLVHRMLSKEKTDRPTMSEAAQTLESLSAILPVANRTTARFVPQQWRVAGGGLIAALTILLVLHYLNSQPSSESPTVSKSLQTPIQPSASEMPSPRQLSAPTTGPRQVQWRIETIPPGATVLDKQGNSLGTTPWEHRLIAQDGETTLRLKREGYEESSISLASNQNEKRSIKLTALAIHPVPVKTTKRKDPPPLPKPEELILDPPP